MTSPTTTITIDGKFYPLRLTLGALAEMEEAFGGDVDALVERLERPSVADILVILHALLTGGGAVITLEALKASDLDLSGAARAIGKTFETLGGPIKGDNDAPGKSRSGAA